TLEQIDPQPIDGDLLLMERRSADDERGQSIVRVDAATGDLKWRLTLDDACSQPAVSGDRIYLAGQSGKLHVVEASSGTREGYLQFSQPLHSPPGVHEERGLLYVAGEHSSIYAIDTNENSCIAVYYSKHPRGAVVAAPVVVLDKLAVVVNDGAQTCKLHLLTLGDQGAIVA